MTKKNESIKCARCGKFISYADIATRRTGFEYEPDSHFGRAVLDHICVRCFYIENPDSQKQRARP